jgi:hypothetical protein
MVRSIDENDFDRRFPKRFGRSQAPETAANDHYSRPFRLLPIRTIDRIEISIVHPFFLKPLSPEISENLGFSRRLVRGDDVRFSVAALYPISLTPRFISV